MDDPGNIGQSVPEDHPAPLPPAPIETHEDQNERGDGKKRSGGEKPESEEDLLGVGGPIPRAAGAGERTRVVDWLQFSVNAALALIGGAGIVIYVGQLCAMNRTLSEIQKQTPEIQRQARAAEDQLAQARIDSDASGIATAKQLSLLQSQLNQEVGALRLDQRAWIALYVACPVFESSEMPTMSHDECSPAPKGQLPIQGSVFFRNFGKTPALNVHAWTNWKESQEEIPKFDSDPIPNELRPKGMFAPNTYENMTSRIPKTVVDSINQGSFGGYMFGTVWYDDIFGRHHWTQYCVGIAPYFQAFTSCRIHSGSDGTRPRYATN